VSGDDSSDPVHCIYCSADTPRSWTAQLNSGCSVITPWNYPHLCTVNSVLPALLAGNAVLLKPAPQTPVPGERFLSTFLAAGLPTNLLQVVHLSQEMTLGKFVSDPRIKFVAFTGSVMGGRAVQQAASSGKGFKGVGLELGGKDPAYVRADADVDWTAEQLVDGMSWAQIGHLAIPDHPLMIDLIIPGAMFNSGQSCESPLSTNLSGTYTEGDAMQVAVSNGSTSIHPSTNLSSSDSSRSPSSTSLATRQSRKQRSDRW